MADQREEGEAGEKEACRDQIKESDKEEVGESRWVFLEIDGFPGCARACVCVCVCVCVCWFERLPLTSAAFCVVLWGVQRCARH